MSAEGVAGCTLSSQGRGPGSIPVSALHLRSDARDEAKALVLEHHYSHRWPSCARFVVTWHEPGGLFGDRGPAVAAVAFGDPAARWRTPVWELQRLIRLPGADVPGLTSLIASAISEVKRQGLADLVISYADPAAGHHGGVYQAGSWRYGGARDPAMIGCKVGGKEVHGRVLNHQYGTRSPSKLRGLTGVDVEPVFDVGRHLYWRALNRRGKAKARRLGLKSLPYPKPGKV